MYFVSIYWKQKITDDKIMIKLQKKIIFLYYFYNILIILKGI